MFSSFGRYNNFILPSRFNYSLFTYKEASVFSFMIRICVFKPHVCYLPDIPAKQIGPEPSATIAFPRP